MIVTTPKKMRKHFIFMILVPIVTLSLAQDSNQKPGFIATFPSSVLPGITAKFCIRLRNLDSDVRLTVNDDAPNSFDQFEKVISKDEAESCVDVPINTQLNETIQKKIFVKGESLSGNYKFEDSKFFEYKTKTSFTLIETDKPAYKPGDKVRIRILTLNYDLKPVAKTYELIYATDSSGSRVNQWLNVGNNNGLIELEMPLSEEPNLGKWKIQVMETNNPQDNIIAGFEVKKYVLPKFEVKLNHKAKIPSTDKKLDVNVCGKYSHGNSVKGKYEVNALTKKFSYETYKTVVHKKISKSLDTKGCAEFQFDLAELGFKSNDHIMNNEVHLEAQLTEADTNIVANASSIASFSNSNIDVELIEPTYYKPGIPINIKLLVKVADGKPLPNEEVDIELIREGVTFYKNKYTSDSNGYLFFTFNPIDAFSHCGADCKSSNHNFYAPATIFLKASPKNKEKDTQPSYYFTRERNFEIQPWQSGSNSYIQIYSPDNLDINCGDEVKSKIMLRSPKKINDKIYFEVQSKTGVVSSGHYNIKTEETVLTSKDDQTNIKFSNLEFKQEPISSLPDTDNSGKARSNSCGLGVKPEFEAKKDDEPYDERTIYYFQQKKWYYVENLNLCKEVPDSSKEKIPTFDSKRICEETCKIAPSYNIAGLPVSNKNYKDVVFYENTFELRMKATSDLSPQAKILVFFIDDGEIIPDSMTIKVNKCFKNKVDLTMSQSTVQVGKRVELTINSEPGSLCAVSGIDKSVSFMGNRNSIQFDNVFSALAQFEFSYDNDNKYKNVGDQECDSYRPPYMPMPRERPVLSKRRIMWPHYSASKIYDSTKAFRDSRVVYLSDYEINQECQRNYPIYFAMGRSGIMRQESLDFIESPMMSNSIADVPMQMKKNAKDEVVIHTVRQYFPETWLWSLDVSNEDGLIKRKEKVPDSITDWILDSYCISEKSGIGISPTKVLKVFQPLFVSIDLPYSVIRGETFQVKASVFNFESTCVPVQIEINPDKRLKLNNLSNKAVKTCICADDKATHKFDLTALLFDMDEGLKIGVKVVSINDTDICSADQKITKQVTFFDSETRTILVEPEGVPKENVESFFVLFKSNQLLSDQALDIKIPENVVDKSMRGYLSITGDSMGPVLNNLDNLVQQPTGCGEQNMVKFAPIKSVAAYLTDTHQITPKMSNLTQEYLRIGYQRQLTYRHPDGSFSAFGPNANNEIGGTWLTSFVLRVLAETFKLNLIKIDENDIKLSLKFLLDKTQDENGCFKQVGTPLFSKALAGGLKDQKTGLSAYVLLSILKSVDALGLKNEEYQAKIEKGIKYLKTSLNKIEDVDTYTLGLILYVLKLGDTDDRFITRVDEELNRRAVSENGFKYWTESGKKKDDEAKPSWLINQSADLEMTSYILLAKLFKYSNEDLSVILPIVKWINSQRNSLGGFYSTQDTVVALDALSQFASTFYSKNINLKVNYNFNSNKNTLFINDKNRLLVQKVKLDKLKENEENSFTFDIEGEGTALVQIILKYNLKEEDNSKKKDDFEFSIFSSRSAESDCKEVELTIKAKYVGDKEASSMAIVALRLPTGWEAVEHTVESLKEKVGLRRHEINENRVHLYFDQLNKSDKEFKIKVVKKYEIKNTKPGLISVYDYYEALDESTTQLFEMIETC